MPPVLRAVPADDALPPANRSSANKCWQTSTGPSYFDLLSPEVRSLHANSQPRNRVLLFKTFQVPHIFENNFQLRAADPPLPCQDQTCGRGGFDQSLQTIQVRLGNFARFFSWIENMFVNTERIITIVHKKNNRFVR